MRNYDYNFLETAACPDIAATTIEKVLSEMRREGIIKTVGAGRGTKWCKT